MPNIGKWPKVPSRLKQKKYPLSIEEFSYPILQDIENHILMNIESEKDLKKLIRFSSYIKHKILMGFQFDPEECQALSLFDDVVTKRLLTGAKKVLLSANRPGKPPKVKHWEKRSICAIAMYNFKQFGKNHDPTNMKELFKELNINRTSVELNIPEKSIRRYCEDICEDDFELEASKNILGWLEYIFPEKKRNIVLADCIDIDYPVVDPFFSTICNIRMKIREMESYKLFIGGKLSSWSSDTELESQYRRKFFKHFQPSIFAEHYKWCKEPEYSYMDNEWLRFE